MAWLVNFLLAALFLPLPFPKTQAKESALERTMLKAQGLLSHAHPENSIVFFRNIMLAKKLQFLGQVESIKNDRKAQIAYNVGKAHAGIEDFLMASFKPGCLVRIFFRSF